MKKYKLSHLLVSVLIVSFTSCADYFIEKPSVIGLDLYQVFSSSKNVEGAIAEAYASLLSSGLPVETESFRPNVKIPVTGTEAMMGGEDCTSITYGYMRDMIKSGMSPSGNSGFGYSDDYFPVNYTFIRKAWVIVENIDRVSDMTAEMKTIVKAEMKVLIAFRYLEMLKRYGGVPLVKKTLSVFDVEPRSTVEATVNYILELCAEGAAGLDGVVWEDKWNGRVNKGVALAIKAETLMYAARPLFNNTSPYLPMNSEADNSLICFGNYDKERWKAAYEANIDVINWGMVNDFVLLTDSKETGATDEETKYLQAFDNYGRAVGTPSNKEVLLAYKSQLPANNANGLMLNYWMYGVSNVWNGYYRGMSYELLIQYKKRDGTEQSWPLREEVSSPIQRDASDYQAKARQMEARALASLYFFGITPQNNIGNNKWSAEPPNKPWQLMRRVSTNPAGVAKNIKFWYKCGTRDWFEFPIYRMAEFYLNAAEAYNEYGNASKALEYLNYIRTRAGLPAEVETDQIKLRVHIQREWAVEFYQENQYYPHARHWKMGAEMIGGFKHRFNFSTYADGPNKYSGDGPIWANEFNKYWIEKFPTDPYMWKENMYLSPFQQTEIDKGYLVQNPGY